MGILRTLADRFDRPQERRDVSSRDPYLAEHLGIRETATGQLVTPERATGIAAVHACVQLIAETVATLPLEVYRRLDNGGRQSDPAHPLYPTLHDRANRIQTAMEFREQLTASVLLTGNGYALKLVDGAGNVAELLPIPPGFVQPEKLVNGRVRYIVTAERGGTQVYLQDEILHVRYRSIDGFTGLSPITIARETIGLGLSQQEFQASTLRNGARLSGALKHPGSLTEKALENLKKSLREQVQGPRNAGNILVLEEGMEWTAISMSLEDLQFIEHRRLTLEDVARIFRVPPPAIGILDKATFSNITEQGRNLVAYTLRPWLVRIEQAMMQSLLTADGRRTHFLEHNAEGLLRGDTGVRYTAYRTGVTSGFLTRNEVRAWENLEPLEGLDEPLEPMNMAAAGTQAPPNNEGAVPPGPSA